MSNSIMGSRIPPIPQNPKKIFEIFGRVVKAGKKFFEVLFKGDDGVKDTQPMDSEKSSADDIMKLNSMLLEYRDKVSKESKQVEDEIKEVCKVIFEQIVESVEFANTEYRFYRIETLQRKLDSYLTDIDGVFTKHVSNRISLDDSECVNVLKMLPGELKAQKMAEMKKRVFTETIEDLCRKIEEFQTDFSEGMEMTVEDKLISLENSLNERKVAFNKMTEKTDNTEKEKLVICTNSKFQYAKADLAYMVMEGEI